MSIETWCLLAAGERARAAAVTARVAFGARGFALRRVEVGAASADVQDSATDGAALAYELLQREKYIDRRAIASFSVAAPLENVHGRSADLAFALAFAFAASVVHSRHRIAVAASGRLEPSGAVLGVECASIKLEAALDALPRGTLVLLPSDNESEIDRALLSRAESAGVAVAFVSRLEDSIALAGIAVSRTWRGSPFRGLEPFRYEHAAILFGRDEEVSDLLEMVRRASKSERPGVLLIGPSGSGKSSLVQAGLLPASVRRRDAGREAHVVWGMLSPRDFAGESDDISAVLKRAWMHGQEGGIIGAADDADVSTAESCFEWLAAHAQNRPTKFMLVLDQLEGWLSVDLTLADRVGRLVVGLSRKGVCLVGTVTRAAVTALDAHPAFGQCFGVEGRYELKAGLDGPRLKEVISAPAKAARLHFEEGLEFELFQSASRAGEDVLPVLELLLTELYERRDTNRDLLRRADYQTVGGLDGVVASRAENAFSEAAHDEKAEIDELLWRLIANGEILASDHDSASPLMRLAERFMARRLLVSDAQPESGFARLRPAHDALLRLWPRAIAWREERGPEVRLWADLQREAAQWREKSRALIPDGPQLAAACSLVDRRAGRWAKSDEATIDFVRRSQVAVSRRKLLVRAIVAAPLVGGAGLGLRQVAAYLGSRNQTVVEFSAVATPGPNYFVAAAPHLRRFGISLISRDPEGAHLLIKSNNALYEGMAANPFRGDNFLIMEADPPTAPVSYVLGFERGARAVIIERAGLWAASSSGVSHPAWVAVAYDGQGGELARVGEGTLARFRQNEEIAPSRLRLEARPGAQIASLAISSDFRDEAGEPYAAFQSVLVASLTLLF